jgi:uridine kinase
MPLVYVTGISGAGKSAVCDELQRRGHAAHDTDREGNAVWIDRNTGAVATNDDGFPDRPVGWLAQHEWRMVPERIRYLATRAEDQIVFLCGSTANEDEVWNVFSSTIYLSIDEKTLRHRLETRTTNSFGKSPDELAAILEWHKVGEAQYRAFGSTIVDATRPLSDVVDDVIALAASG